MARLKVAFVVTSDWSAATSWSATATRMAEALPDESTDVEVIGPLREPFRLGGRIRRRVADTFGRTYQHYRHPRVARAYARQVAQRLEGSSADVVLSVGAVPVAYLETRVPIVLWADATFASLVGYYPSYEGITRRTLAGGYAMDRAVLERAAAAIFASDWAAASAIRDYGVDPPRVHVVPYGGNLAGLGDLAEVRTMIKSRPRDECRLLFVGFDWARKRGEDALEIARRLNDVGLASTLTIVGKGPRPPRALPPYVRLEGLIGSATPSGRQRLRDLFSRSHLLLLPTSAETFGIVLAEASAHAVPSLATATGGIPTAIRPGRNGALFGLADVDAYCSYIQRLFDHYEDEYVPLAEASFAEAADRLNWSTWGESVRRVLRSVANG